MLQLTMLNLPLFLMLTTTMMQMSLHLLTTPSLITKAKEKDRSKARTSPEDNHRRREPEDNRRTPMGARQQGGGPYGAAPQCEPQQDWGNYRGPIWNQRPRTMSHWPQPGEGKGPGKTYTRGRARVICQADGDALYE
jgi:hypothetical protein